MKIIIASDHHGVGIKAKIIKFLKKLGHEVDDYGTNSEEIVDYPEYAFKTAESVQRGEADLGILLCGTGIGMSIAANKVRGIHCAKIDNVNDARLAKEHNNANVLAMSSNKRFWLIKKMLVTFLNTKPSKVERYARRRKIIDNYIN